MPQFSIQTATAVFKNRYIRLSRDMFNSSNVTSAKIKRRDDFTGEYAIVSVPLSFSGGIGSGSLPVANVSNYQRAQFAAFKTYALIELDREAMKASADDEGAFVRASKEQVKRGVQSWQRNYSRILFNDSLVANGNGRLGSFSGNQVLVSPDVYDVTITAASWKLANFEPRDYINVNANTALFNIVSVTPATRVIRVQQVAGPTFDLSTIGAGTHNIYMQGSRNNDPTGLRGALLATTGNLYNIPIQYRWQSPSQIAAGGVSITPDLLNQQTLDIKYGFGETPDMMVNSFVQYRKLLNQLEDQKRYMIVESRYSGPKGKFSFSALEFMSDTGPIPIVPERFVEDDTHYTLNSDFIEVFARPDSGWVDDDLTGGGIFLRNPTTDSFQARYAVYYENFITPTAHGIITGLATV